MTSWQAHMAQPVLSGSTSIGAATLRWYFFGSRHQRSRRNFNPVTDGTSLVADRTKSTDTAILSTGRGSRFTKAGNDMARQTEPYLRLTYSRLCDLLAQA